MTFTATIPDPPTISLKAILAWKYFFECGWAVVKTQDGVWIVMD